MNNLNKTIEHGIASLKALREEPTEGNAHKIIEEIKALNNIDVSGLKKPVHDNCGHCSSGVDCQPSCEMWYINSDFEQLTESFVIYFQIQACDSDDAKFGEVTVNDKDGNEIELNKGELFWIEKAIQEKLAY